MTPAKEKAKELVDRFTFNCRECDYEDNAIRCALIAVDEILNEYWSHNTERRDWWKEVKNEIEKR